MLHIHWQCRLSQQTSALWWASIPATATATAGSAAGAGAIGRAVVGRSVVHVQLLARSNVPCGHAQQPGGIVRVVLDADAAAAAHRRRPLRPSTPRRLIHIGERQI